MIGLDAILTFGLVLLRQLGESLPDGGGVFGATGAVVRARQEGNRIGVPPGSMARIVSSCSAPSSQRPSRTRIEASRNRPCWFSGSSSTTRSMSGRPFRHRSRRRRSGHGSSAPERCRDAGRRPGRTRRAPHRALASLVDAAQQDSRLRHPPARARGLEQRSGRLVVELQLDVEPAKSEGRRRALRMRLDRLLQEAPRLVEVGELAKGLGQCQQGELVARFELDGLCERRRSRPACAGWSDRPHRARPIPLEHPASPRASAGRRGPPPRSDPDPAGSGPPIAGSRGGTASWDAEQTTGHAWPESTTTPRRTACPATPHAANYTVGSPALVDPFGARSYNRGRVTIQRRAMSCENRPGAVSL